MVERCSDKAEVESSSLSAPIRLRMFEKLLRGQQIKLKCYDYYWIGFYKEQSHNYVIMAVKAKHNNWNKEIYDSLELKCFPKRLIDSIVNLDRVEFLNEMKPI